MLEIASNQEKASLEEKPQVAPVVKNLTANARDMGSIPGYGRSPGEENGNPHQYLCLESSMDRGAWWATVHAVPKESDNLASENI